MAPFSAVNFFFEGVGGPVLILFGEMLGLCMREAILILELTRVLLRQPETAADANSPETFLTTTHMTPLSATLYATPN